MSEKRWSSDGARGQTATAGIPGTPETGTPSTGLPVLEARNLIKEYPAPGGRTLMACHDVSLTLCAGRTLGIVGESGCGKSTFMRMAVGLEKPTSGEIIFDGQDLAKLRGGELRRVRRHIQMVFQDPTAAFDPKMKVRDIICEPLESYGLIRRRDRDAAARRYLEMVELPAEFADRFPHQLSGGQRQRVGIARALTLEPEIIMCDEATSALDVSVQAAVIDLLVRLQREKNISICFIGHDLALVQSFAHEVAVMYLGHIVEILPGAAVAHEAAHPYTKALLGAVFDPGMDFSKKIESIEGEAPSPLDAPRGCPFRDRCSCAMEICASEHPHLTETAPGHQVACHMFAAAENVKK